VTSTGNKGRRLVEWTQQDRRPREARPLCNNENLVRPSWAFHRRDLDDIWYPLEGGGLPTDTERFVGRRSARSALTTISPAVASAGIRAATTASRPAYSSSRDISIFVRHHCAAEPLGS
jgi:hypothetical protein